MRLSEGARDVFTYALPMDPFQRGWCKSSTLRLLSDGRLMLVGGARIQPGYTYGPCRRY